MKEENRKRALERVKKNSNNLPHKIATTFPNSRAELTQDQKKRIEENRLKAIEIRNRLQQNNRDGSTNSGINLVKNPHNSSTNTGTYKIKKDTNRIPLIKRKDYIEYDFSTMTDTKGGFIGNDDGTNGSSIGSSEMSLDQWKEKQKQIQIVRDLPPPIDIDAAPKCVECNSLEIDPLYLTNFDIKVCRKCIKNFPDKYSLLTKTECREDYLLTDPELKDKSLLPRIEKPNPHGYLRMQLFVRLQVEKFAWKKWGSAEGLDEEWERREAMKIKRRDKRYQDKLKEMRKKTRAEEYTRKLRDGKSLGERHTHEWSAPLKLKEENTYMRRCLGCGVETEQVLI